MGNDSIFGLIAKHCVPITFVIDLDYPTNNPPDVLIGDIVEVTTNMNSCDYLFRGTVTYIAQPMNDKVKAIATVFFVKKENCPASTTASFTVSVHINPYKRPFPTPLPVVIPAPLVTDKIGYFDIP